MRSWLQHATAGTDPSEPAPITQDDFAERLRQLVGEAEDAGLHRHEMIAELEVMALAMRGCEAE